MTTNVSTRSNLATSQTCLLHQRYIVIRGEHVVDLISDEQFMSEKAQLGLKISFPEYVAEVERALNGLTVKDLIGKLWGETKRLSTSSSVKDIVFLTQNLFTLGGFVVDEGSPIAGGPLKPILDRVANQFFAESYSAAGTGKRGAGSACVPDTSIPTRTGPK